MAALPGSPMVLSQIVVSNSYGGSFGNTMTQVNLPLVSLDRQSADGCISIVRNSMMRDGTGNSTRCTGSRSGGSRQETSRHCARGRAIRQWEEMILINE